MSLAPDFAVLMLKFGEGYDTVAFMFVHLIHKFDWEPLCKQFSRIRRIFHSFSGCSGLVRARVSFCLPYLCLFFRAIAELVKSERKPLVGIYMCFTQHH